MRQATFSAGVFILGCAAASGQTFDVASVKPAAPPQPGPGGRMFYLGTRGGPGTSDPGQITWSNATLKNLLTTAYDVKPYQIRGPGWLDTERYDVVAKVPPGTTKEQVRVMWQNLLAERFGVVLHHESKEFQAQELVAVKGGPKLQETTLDPNAAPSPPPSGPPGPPKFDKNGFPEMSSPGFMMLMQAGPTGPVGRMIAKAQPISALVNALGNQLNRPVVDKTGLTGKYDFTLEYTPDLNGLPPPPGGAGPGPVTTPSDTASEPGSNLAAAVQQQLGLKLVAHKAKLDVLVIDKANKAPTEN